ncbi:hypothetical protein F4775DRAFT_483425 [Biscogniauxia sp. FL1348]|nr:hypothetical protein F4775DRAFT_483425 [Biscogniauxia sp. FL1348]
MQSIQLLTYSIFYFPLSFNHLSPSPSPFLFLLFLLLFPFPLDNTHIHAHTYTRTRRHAIHAHTLLEHNSKVTWQFRLRLIE